MNVIVRRNRREIIITKAVQRVSGKAAHASNDIRKFFDRAVNVRDYNIACRCASTLRASAGRL
jgi:hypothetical protein